MAVLDEKDTRAGAKISGAEAITLCEESVRRRILEGLYRPGQRVSDSALADELGISRTSVRETFQRLVKEGLLQTIPNRGAFVAELTEGEVHDLYEVREALETLAVHLATVRAPLERLLELREMLSQTERSMRSQGGRYPVELDFHKSIIELADNAELSRHLSAVHNRLRIVRGQSGYQTERALLAYFEHLAILDAMIRRDSEAAQSQMRAHLIESRVSVSSVKAPTEESHQSSR